MFQQIQLTNPVPPVTNSISQLSLQRGSVLIAIALVWFAFSPPSGAVCTDNCLSNGNTAQGEDALFLLTTGFNNTAFGFHALYDTEDGNSNTAVGTNALASTFGSNNTAVGDAAARITEGNNNTAVGNAALEGQSGDNNTATGYLAMQGNGIFTLAYNNTANGAFALELLVTGSNNVAVGYSALQINSDGSYNTANGAGALLRNTIGNSNTADGYQALISNTTGNENTALGLNALFSNTTGSRNIGLGAGAGGALTTGDDNIDIGTSGVAGESATIRIGTVGAHRNTYIAGIYGVNVPRRALPVFIASNGHLGTRSSSARFKDQIEPMDRTSEAIFALRPVTFCYKKELDPDGTPQFGLVAEEVEKINPDLVVRDDEGKPYTVRYEAVNAMLLNEFLKEHRKVEQQEAAITQLKSIVSKQEAIIAQQEKGMKVFAARLEQQSAQIQTVNNQLQAKQPALRLVSKDN